MVLMKKGLLFIQIIMKTLFIICIKTEWGIYTSVTI